MRKFSTRIGVYAILLITAFYGTLSVTNQQGKTAPNVAEIIQKWSPSEGKVEITSRNYHLSKNDNSTAVSSATLQANKDIYATAVVETTFFTHSATIQHYISTI